MFETKTLTVSPQAEQSTIDLFACFAWNLKSSQEIKTKDSHLERRGDDIYNVTETEHYIKLVFERDTKRENYERIKELENTYVNIMSREPEKEYVKINGIVAFVLLLLYVIPGVLYLTFKFRKRKKAADTFAADFASWKEEEKIAIAALEEAKSLA